MKDAPKHIPTRVILGVSAAAITIAILAHQPEPDDVSMALNTGTAEPAPTSAPCREADRTAVDQLAAFLERNGPTDAPVLERAIHTLNLARRHCFYDWDGRGLDDYQWLSRWLSEHSVESSGGRMSSVVQCASIPSCSSANPWSARRTWINPIEG